MTTSPTDIDRDIGRWFDGTPYFWVRDPSRREDEEEWREYTRQYIFHRKTSLEIDGKLKKEMVCEDSEDVLKYYSMWYIENKISDNFFYDTTTAGAIRIYRDYLRYGLKVNGFYIHLPDGFFLSKILNPLGYGDTINPENIKDIVSSITPNVPIDHLKIAKDKKDGPYRKVKKEFYSQNIRERYEMYYELSRWNVYNVVLSYLRGTSNTISNLVSNGTEYFTNKFYIEVIISRDSRSFELNSLLLLDIKQFIADKSKSWWFGVCLWDIQSEGKENYACCKNIIVVIHKKTIVIVDPWSMFKEYGKKVSDEIIDNILAYFALNSLRYNGYVVKYISFGKATQQTHLSK